MKPLKYIFILIFALSAFGSTAYADEPVPAWMRQAAGFAVPQYEKDVPAVVLLDEERVTLVAENKLSTEENFAVKMLTNDGRHFAVARALYLVSSGKVREIEAWLIRPNGSVKYYDKKTILDMISDPDDVYNEYRVKIIDASRDVDVGSVFGYRVISDDTPLFYQDTWNFQGRLPTLVSKYSITLPVGWTASSITFNANDVKPQVTGQTYTWELRDLSPIPPEPLSPSVMHMTPRLAVNYSPAGGSPSAANRTFNTWQDVSEWASQMYDPAVVIDDNIAAKARELTSNAKTELEKIKAVGTYVQNLQYISIDIGVGYGNGYRPRSSALVMSRGYGDCKDKANLMRAMLRTLKIESYPIAIYSGDPDFVQDKWVTPRQFNHAILAVKVSDETVTPTILKTPELGRLLIFDATDSYTPVGDLPDYLQNSMALIIAGKQGSLQRMPVTPQDFDVLDREIVAEVSPLGELKGTIKERASGQVSTAFRSQERIMSSTDYRNMIERWLTYSVSGAQLLDMKSTDRHLDAEFDLDINFAAKNFGQIMQNRLMIFKPVIVGRRERISLTEEKRKNPVAISNNSLREKITFNLPQGFEVDEIPDAVTLDTKFGKYTTTYEVKDGKLHFSREMTMNRSFIPVSEYKAVKEFFATIQAAEQSPIVLIKK